MSEQTETSHVDHYIEKRNGMTSSLLEYVLVVRRHPLMKIPSWMSPYDALGVDLDGRLVFDCYRRELTKVPDRTEDMFVVAIDPLDSDRDLRLYWNPDTQVWIGLLRGTVRPEGSWAHNRLRRRRDVIAKAKDRYKKVKATTPAASSKVSETLAIRRAARAEAAAASGVLP